MAVHARLCIVTSVVAATVAVMACGGGNTSKSPLAPSSATPSVSNPAPGSAVSGATISGTVVGTLAASRVRTASAGMVVRVLGSSVSSSVVNGQFVLRGVPTGHVELEFDDVGVNARLVLEGVAEGEDIHLSVRVSGSTAAVDDDQRETPDNRSDIEGLVTAINASARTLSVGTSAVMVPAGTPVRHDGTSMDLSQIHIGDRVEVQGMKNGTTLVATEIEVKTSTANPAPGDNGDDHGADAELNGTISGKSGTCPSLSFTVASTTVVTNAKTDFHDAACSALAGGDRVEVKGSRQTNGSVVATRVEKQ
jgi:Domain of unknown function (DUF5666)